MKTRSIKLLSALAVLVMALGALGPASADPSPMQAPTEAAMGEAMTDAADWTLTVTGTDGQLSPPGGSPAWEPESGGRISLHGMALLRAYQVTGTQAYLDRAEACGDLVIASAEAAASYVVYRTGVQVTEAGGGFPDAQPGKVDDAYQASFTGTLRFDLWESLQGMWLMAELYEETGEGKYQNGALLLDRMVGNHFYYDEYPRKGLVKFVTLANNGTWTQGGRASISDHALMLQVISVGGRSVPNLYRDQNEFTRYVQSNKNDDGSFDDNNDLPNQDGPNETKHALMIPALIALGRPTEASNLANWVMGQQNPDGSFACPRDKDPIGDTAVASLGLLPVGPVTEGGGGVKWLIDHQRTDGSWDAQPGLDIVTTRILSTQWAMLALHAGLTNYNLIVEDDMVTADPIWEGDPAKVMGFTVNVTVANEGLVAVSGAQVRLYDGPKADRVLLNQSTVDMPALGSAFTSLEFRPLERGPHEIHVWVVYPSKGEFRTRDNNVSISVNINRRPTGAIGMPKDGQLFGFGAVIEFQAIDVEDLDGDDVTLTWVDDIDGFLSNEESFSKVLTPGDHRVTLTFEDGNGPSRWAEVSLSVRENIPPTVRISTPAEDARYFDYQTVAFDASASSDAEDHDLSFTWESDKDGILGYEAVISKKLGPGVHTITVWVDDSWDNVSREVSIRIVETFPPDVVISSPFDGETYVTTTRVSFESAGTSDPDSDILEYFWRSNIDGLLSERPQFLRFLSVGHHVITLSVDDGNYNRSKTVEIDVMDNRAPVAMISSPVHDSSYMSLDPVELNASESYDLEDPLTYFWVSDREGPLGSEPVFTALLSRGSHSITLWVNDGHGHNVSTSVEITIINMAPTAGISSPEPGTVFKTGQTVLFMSGTSFDPEGDRLMFEWYVRPSDGEWAAIGTNARAERSFTAPGNYEVRLVVSDGKETDNATATFQLQLSDSVDETDENLLGNPVFIGAIVLVLIVVVVVVYFVMKARD